MIEKMHERTNSLAFKIIFALISISFVLGGLGTGMMMSESPAVKINGEEISQQAFTNAKSREESERAALYGERFWNEIGEPEGAKTFHTNILNGLIDQSLIRQYVDELKLGISVQQIQTQIVNNPNFHTDGKFDNNVYLQALQSLRLTPDEYAAVVGQQMVLAQIQAGIIDSHFSVPAQDALLAKLLLQKRHVRLAAYPIADEINKQTASEEELSSYFEANKNLFNHPEKVQVEYVLITPKMLEERIQVTDEQIQTYYQTNKAQLENAGNAKVAHIQVETEAEAKAIYAELKKGADFATLASDKSIDRLTAIYGGDLGWIKSGVFPKAFEEAVEKLPLNEVSEPVKVDGAYHLIKVQARVTFEQLKEQIASLIRQDLVLTEYSNITREMANRAFENSSSLEGVAQAANIKVQKTDLFSRDALPKELNHEAVIKAIFNSELRQNGQNSEALVLGDEANPSTMFVRVATYQPVATQTFEEAKQAVEKRVKFEKAEKTLLIQVLEKQKALEGGNLNAVKFEPQTTIIFAERALGKKLTDSIFAMPKPAEKPVYQTLEGENGDVWLIALDKVEDGKVEDAPHIMQQFRQINLMDLAQTLNKNLRERAKIEINEEFMESLQNSK